MQMKIPSSGIERIVTQIAIMLNADQLGQLLRDERQLEDELIR